VDRPAGGHRLPLPYLPRLPLLCLPHVVTIPRVTRQHIGPFGLFVLATVAPSIGGFAPAFPPGGRLAAVWVTRLLPASGCTLNYPWRLYREGRLYVAGLCCCVVNMSFLGIIGQLPK
jgi:hypothetical protein